MADTPLYCKCTNPTFATDTCKSCRTNSASLHNLEVPDLAMQPPSKHRRTSPEEDNERTVTPELEKSQTLSPSNPSEPKAGEDGTPTVNSELERDQTRSASSPPELRPGGDEPIWTGPFHAREQYSHQYGFQPLSPEYIRLTRFAGTNVLDTLGFADGWHPQIWPTFDSEVKYHICGWTTWVDRSATVDLAQKFRQYFRNKIWNLVMEGCLDGSRYDCDEHKFRVQVETFVNSVAECVQDLCRGLQRIRRDIEDVSEKDMTEICTEIDQVFEDYHNRFRSAWSAIAKSSPSLGDASVLEHIEFDDWYGEDFPAGLKCAIPSDRPLPTCMRRFLWPVDFERLAAVWPSHISSLPPYDEHIR